MIDKPPIFVIAPGQDEDLTQYIAYKIAEEAGVNYAFTVSTELAALVVELGGIWDRPCEDGTDAEIMIQDKTKTKAFEQILGLFFKITNWRPERDFQTSSSQQYDSNYVRLELTNKIRYSDTMRDVFIKTVAEILKELKDVL